ncbi:hypothetical protein BC477_19570 [Clavibacter michiganensis subsp. michiganensis]|uniref:Uncharacterized protein n=1 Tax=Clavibacter michiganensis subsp. michiganensis TaxID=33013 RepID=A0A251XHD7_CLAMM|nr:hypothetical protein BC477_19570 [Clavibacter michiganensis subsp. michiganensis]OUE01684.1 hypothetical protein CMMCAS07_15355 [Clavibacter michiganensis subsp. michiganensis]
MVHPVRALLGTSVASRRLSACALARSVPNGFSSDSDVPSGSVMPVMASHALSVTAGGSAK